MKRPRFLHVVGLAALAILTASPALGQEARSGGRLTLRLREDLPQGFAIHESPTISTMWPAMPCLSNLVLFDPMRLSTLWVGFSGSKSTRLLRHGMAGHMVEIVGLSWMAKPCGRSSRSLKVSEPPTLGAWPRTGEAVTITSAARPTT